MKTKVKKKTRKPGSGRKATDLSSLNGHRPETLVIPAGAYIGTTLKMVRKSLGVTASAVARAIEYDPCNISHFENGTGAAGGRYLTDTAIKYAKVLGVKQITFVL